MATKADLLTKLALKEFPDLTDAEREVLRAAATGEVADLAQWGTPSPNRNKFNCGGGKLRSALVEWLCTYEQAQRLVTHKGLLIFNATVDDPINLLYAHVGFPLRFRYSVIHSIYLYMAHMCDFELSFSTVTTIYANNSNVNGCIYLYSTIIDDFSISHSKVHGHIFCNGAKFCGNKTDTKKHCFNGYGLELFGDIYFNNGFLCNGEICLIDATIYGKIDCRNCTLLNPGRTALSADRITIKSTALLSNCFIAEGLVRFNGAIVLGQFHCEGGYFSSGESLPVGKKDAITSICLSADSAKFHSDVLLSDDFFAAGLVRFLGASIFGQLDCRNSHFLNENDRCIDFSHTTFNNVIIEPIEVSGEIFLLGMHATGGLRLKSSALSNTNIILNFANIGYLLDTKESWPTVGLLELNGLRYDSIHETSPCTPSERFEWLNRQPVNNFYPQPYEELASFYERTGHDSFAKGVRIEKENARQRHFKNPIKLAWWFLKWVTIGYGYRPYFALIWLVLLIAIGSSVYWRNIDDMTQSVSYHYNATDSSDIKGDFIASNYPDLNTLFYSIDVALPIIDLQQERYWMPNSDTSTGRKLWWFNWAEVLLGWFLASMGIAGATGIIRKD